MIIIPILFGIPFTCYCGDGLNMSVFLLFSESPAIAYQWIGPGFVLSLAAIMLASTVAFYIWHTTHKWSIGCVLAVVECKTLVAAFLSICHNSFMAITL